MEIEKKFCDVDELSEFIEFNKLVEYEIIFKFNKVSQKRCPNM